MNKFILYPVSILALYIGFSAMDGVFGSFSISLTYLCALILLVVFIPACYVINTQRVKINKIFIAKEIHKKEMAGTYPATMCEDDIFSGENETKSYYWRVYLKSFIFNFLFLSSVTLFISYGVSVAAHNDFVPFSTLKNVRLNLLNKDCPPDYHTVQVCKLTVKRMDGTLNEIKAPTSAADDLITGSNFMIEYKYSFIGHSIARYRLP